MQERTLLPVVAMDLPLGSLLVPDSGSDLQFCSWPLNADALALRPDSPKPGWDGGVLSRQQRRGGQP